MQKNKINNHYPKETYPLLVDIEPKHFWFNGRNLILKSFIQSVIPKTKNVSFLEIGCGTGFVLAFLETLGFQVSGVDMHKGAFKYAQKRTSAPLYSGNIENLSLRQFHCLGAFDVLEHVGDEVVFLRACHRLLKKNGYIFLMMPAHMHLWSTIDEVAGHKRRYNTQHVACLLQKEGFKVRRVSYYGACYYIPQLLQRVYLRTLPSKKQREKYEILTSTLRVPPSPINFALYFFMRIESYLLKYFNLPFGSSVIVCAQKTLK